MRSLILLLPLSLALLLLLRSSCVVHAQGVCAPPCQHDGYCNASNECICRDYHTGIDCRQYQCPNQPAGFPNPAFLNASKMCTRCDANHDGIFCQRNKTCGYQGAGIDDHLVMYAGVVPLGDQHSMECAVRDATFIQLLGGPGDLIVECSRERNASWSKPPFLNSSKCMLQFMRTSGISRKREEFFSCYSTNCSVRHVRTNLNRNPTFASNATYKEPAGAQALRGLLATCGIAVGALFLVPLGNARLVYLSVALSLTVLFVLLSAGVGSHLNQSENAGMVQYVDVESAVPQLHGYLTCANTVCRCNMDALDTPSCKIGAVQELVEKGIGGRVEIDCNNDTSVCAFAPKGDGALARAGFTIALQCSARTCIDRATDTNVSVSELIILPAAVDPAGLIVGVVLGVSALLCLLTVVVVHCVMRRSTARRWTEMYPNLVELENALPISHGVQAPIELDNSVDDVMAAGEDAVEMEQRAAGSSAPVERVRVLGARPAVPGADLESDAPSEEASAGAGVAAGHAAAVAKPQQQQQQQQQQHRLARRRSSRWTQVDEIVFSLEVRNVSYVVRGLDKSNNASPEVDPASPGVARANTSDTKFRSVHDKGNDNSISQASDTNNNNNEKGGSGAAATTTATAGEDFKLQTDFRFQSPSKKKPAEDPPRMSYVRYQQHLREERQKRSAANYASNNNNGGGGDEHGENGGGAFSDDEEGADEQHLQANMDQLLRHPAPVIDAAKEPDARLILDRVSFQLTSGRVCALIGGSGAGKSSVLDILCNRPKTHEQHGQVLLDGVDIRTAPHTYNRLLSYVSDEDALLPTQTVTEALHFAANLRLPVHVPDQQKDLLVEHAIDLFGLRRVAHNVIGSQMTSVASGLSHGERRRLAIATMVITFPRVLVLDEPSSGLDSFNARKVVHVLKHISRGTLCRNLPYFAAAFPYKPIVILSIHQPSPDMFMTFDEVLLLAQGNCIFAGPTPHLEYALERCGLFDRASPISVPDQALEVSCTLSDGNLREMAAINRGKVARAIERSRRPQPLLHLPATSVPDRGSASQSPLFSAVDSTQDFFPDYVEQVSLLLRRGWLHLVRKPAIFSLHFLVSTVVALIISGMYNASGKDINMLLGKAGLISFYSLFVSLTSMSALDLILSERSTYIFERASEAYSTVSYFSAKVILDFLLLRVLPTAIACCLFYFQAGFLPEAHNFGLFTGTAILFAVAMAGLSICIASVANTFATAILANALLVMLFFAFGGLISQDEGLPPSAAWVRWISPFAFIFESVLGSDLKGLLCFFYVRGPTGAPLTETPLPIPCETFLDYVSAKVSRITVDIVMLAVWTAIYGILSFLTLHFVAKGAR